MKDSNINGFQNEFQIAAYLNGKQVKDLNIMFKSFIEDFFSNVNN